MQVVINGQSRDLPNGATAADIIELLGLQGKRLAMEINEEILPRSQYPDHTLRDGDHVEIVHAIGGG
ncbi:MAG: sulfur carrier protein ThiS [Gammaproteobacteria bacterium]|nr:sulfur carrier protein ThiS [Gammaproteobacteria bacterium]